VGVETGIIKQGSGPECWGMAGEAGVAGNWCGWVAPYVVWSQLEHHAAKIEMCALDTEYLDMMQLRNVELDARLYRRANLRIAWLCDVRRRCGWLRWITTAPSDEFNFQAHGCNNYSPTSNQPYS
jgi:hypothetical protein